MEARGSQDENAQGSQDEPDLPAYDDGPPPEEYQRDTAPVIIELNELRARIEAARGHYREMKKRAESAEARALKLETENDYLRRLLDAFRPKTKRNHRRRCPDCDHEIKLDDDDLETMLSAVGHGVQLEMDPVEVRGIFLRERCPRKSNHETS